MCFFSWTDGIEIFFVDSHQNGATSWIPKILPDHVKVIITLTKGSVNFRTLYNIIYIYKLNQSAILQGTDL